MDTLSKELQLTLSRVRERVKQVTEGSDFAPQKPDQALMKALFKNLGDRFPLTKKDPKNEGRRIRLGILMAMLGEPISSTYDIDHKVMVVLTEVTNADSSAYLTPELSRELEGYIAGDPYGIPWILPVSSPESVAVPYL